MADGGGQVEEREFLDTSPVNYVSALFIILGVVAFLFLISLITSNESFQAAFEDNLFYQADNLPDGLEIDPSNGLISGEIDAEPGTYRVTVNVSRFGAEQGLEFPFTSFNWIVAEDEANAQVVDAGSGQFVEVNSVSITNPGDQGNVIGENVLLQVDANDGRGAQFGSIFLSFLQNFGIVIPSLILGVGIYCIRMGIKLYRRNLITALWARQLMMWLFIAGAVLMIDGFLSGGENSGGLILAVAPWAFFTGVAWFTMQWLGKNEHLFVGAESITSRQTRTAWNLLVPSIIILILVALQPLEQTFIASLTNERFASSQEIEFVGLDNYTQLLGIRLDTFPCYDDPNAPDCGGEDDVESPRRYYRNTIENYTEWGYRPLNEFSILGADYVLSARDTDFIDSIGNTMLFSVLSVSAELVLGLFIAMVVSSNFSGRGLMRTAMLVPWAIPTVVSARLWEVILRDNQSGILNVALLNTGLIDSSQSWLTNPDLQIISMVFVDVWKTTPFMALLLLAGLGTIPSDVYEAADVDGASKVRQFFSMTLPLLRPTIAVALVFRTLDAVRVFDVFQVLLGGSRFSMASYNYEVLVQRQEFGYASAVGVVIFVIILLFTVGYVRLLGVENN